VIGRTLTLALLYAATVQSTIILPSMALDVDYAKGTELYKAAKYKDALASFSDCIRINPQNSAAYYCIGNCLGATGQKAAAQGWYEALLQRFPLSPYAGLAREALNKNFPGIGTTPQPSQPTIETPRPQGGYIDSAKMIVVVSPKGERPAVSDKFLSDVKSALATMPKATVAFLYEKGCRVFVTPTLIDKNPELQNTHPKGYDEDHTYKQAPAIFDGQSVVVCEHTINAETEGLRPTNNAMGAVRHEFGHAVDHYLGYVSEKQNFRHEFYLDLGRISVEDKVKLHYFCQTADRGPSECFAEVYSGITGGPASDAKHRQELNKSVMENFPKVHAFVNKTLKQMQ